MNHIKYLLALSFTYCIPLFAIDNPHFYRATNNIFNQPRLECPHLSSIDLTVAHGSTAQSFNGEHHSVPLFDLYGPNTLILNGEDTSLSIEGTFTITEANMSLTHNFSHGFFLFFHIPVRNIQIKNSFFSSPSQQNPLLFDQLVKENLLEQSISTDKTKEIGVGDFSSLIGWTHNYQETTILDFIDATFALGVLAPTGKKKNPHELFSLPLGYNGHWAFPFNCMFSLGTYEWITIGSYVHALFFFKNSSCIPLKTSTRTSGFIKETIENVTIHQGPIWNTGAFFTADHFMYGLSFTALYSYAGQATSSVNVHKTECNQDIANTDPALKKWDMHTLHFNAEYDFAQQDSQFGPRIGLFYNYQIKGKRTFNTSLLGGAFGLEIGWRM